MAEELSRPNKNQQRFMQAAYDRFRVIAEWPTFDQIDRQLDRLRPRLDAVQIARTIPGLERLPLEEGVLEHRAGVMLALSGMDGAPREPQAGGRELPLCRRQVFYADEDVIELQLTSPRPP